MYLLDMLAAMKRIEEYCKRGRKAFLEDGLLQDGIIRQVSIVGEAATKLPPAWKKERPDIPWRAITAMRHILIHDYSAINLERVWTVAKEDLQILNKTVQAMLSEVDE